MSEIVYVTTETYPDEYFIVEDEYSKNDFELAKKEFIRYSKEIKQESMRHDNSNELENESYYLVECEKQKLGDSIQSADRILESIEENILDQIELDEVFQKEEREKALSIIEDALNKIKELKSMQGFTYQPLNLPKEERTDKLKTLKCWVYDFEKQELVIA